jgi:hypothetical protein
MPPDVTANKVTGLGGNQYFDATSAYGKLLIGDKDAVQKKAVKFAIQRLQLHKILHAVGDWAEFRGAIVTPAGALSITDSVVAKNRPMMEYLNHYLINVIVEKRDEIATKLYETAVSSVETEGLLPDDAGEDEKAAVYGAKLLQLFATQLIGIFRKHPQLEENFSDVTKMLKMAIGGKQSSGSGKKRRRKH